MTIIEGIGDEVTHFFIALFVIVIGTVAWWTTNISEQRYIRTVVLLERRRHRAHRRLTNHTESVTITEGSSSTSQTEESTPDLSAETDAALERARAPNGNKPPEPRSEEDLIAPDIPSTILEDSRGEEEESIIETMDADANIVRQRRLAFYTGFSNENQEPTSSHTESFRQNTSSPQDSSTSSEDVEPSAPPTEESVPPKNEDTTSNRITVKLKYINDDLKLVEGNLNESLGEFKKRNFVPELSSNKLIRLIFNGQVLQPDTQTLKNCGLFDNCVVHCLIHQKRSQPNRSSGTESRREGYSFPNTNGSANNNNNQNRDWDLGNFLFGFISIILLAAWYFRYVYAHLYTVTATVGLILITGIFTIVLVGMYFPDTEQFPNPAFHIRERTTPQTE
ncbi:transmembrane and ubiquitin-like domain-containing protein 1 [Diabrotica virgifera virgifera]|uniref:Ubiquitin-like domain-containing protein n=1 Tax=Diabrotica virgifera virgifera TaxID=50390 RepID=A0ABM5KIS0_DIAVI|nr:transmembrane and ubiquitin-like domain-containing protein 1 [Diabrotica virgifera virgifera]